MVACTSRTGTSSPAARTEKSSVAPNVAPGLTSPPAIHTTNPYWLWSRPGRDHNQYGLVVWMAGGDVRPGATFGATDDFSVRAAGDEVPVRDVHATILRLLGLDQNRLTFLHAGR